MEFNNAPVALLQNLIVRSAVPAPDANKLRSCGDQASALTAA